MTVKRSDLNSQVTLYNTIRKAVTFTHGAAGGTGTQAPNTASLGNTTLNKATLTSLQACINNLETKFSQNCDCLTNPDCCQTCQETTCQECQKNTCQSCQSVSCQSNCVCDCNCNCSDSDGS